MSRPPIFATPEDFTAAADAYFDACEGDKDAIPTVNGLALALGMTRKCIWDYAGKPEFSYAVEKARTRLEMAWENRLAGTACTGAIFWLKNQGWTDKTQQELSGPSGGPIQTQRVEFAIIDPANPNS